MKEERLGVMSMYPHWFDVALRGITIRSAALSFSLVGHSCTYQIVLSRLVIVVVTIIYPCLCKRSPALHPYAGLKLNKIKEMFSKSIKS